MLVGQAFSDIGGDLALAEGERGEHRHDCRAVLQPAQRRAQQRKQSGQPGDVRVAESMRTGRPVESEHKALRVGRRDSREEYVMNPHGAPERLVGRRAKVPGEVEPFVEGERLTSPARYGRGNTDGVEAVELLPPGAKAGCLHPVGGTLSEADRPAIADYSVETGGLRVKVVGESRQ
jgi:hypothetical protein